MRPTWPHDRFFVLIIRMSYPYPCGSYIEFLQCVQGHRTYMQQHKWIHCTLKQKTIPDQQKTERQQKRQQQEPSSSVEMWYDGNTEKKTRFIICVRTWKMQTIDCLHNLLVYKLKHRAFSQDLHVICTASVRFKMHSHSRQEIIGWKRLPAWSIYPWHGHFATAKRHRTNICCAICH